MKNVLTNLELSYLGATDLLMKGAIAVACSLIPGALSAVDRMMEKTFMKFAKLADIIRFFVHILLGLVTCFMYTTWTVQHVRSISALVSHHVSLCSIP